MSEENDKYHDSTYVKVIIVGNSGAGKTSIIKRYIEKKFDYNPLTTITPITSNKKFIINGNIFHVDLWDLPGQDRNQIISRTFANGSKGIIYCCEVKNINSRNDLKKWEESLKSVSDIETIPKILVENKCDLLGDENNYNDDIKSLRKTSRELGCFSFFRTSALNGYNVDEALETLINKIIKEIKIEKIENDNKIKLKSNKGNTNVKCC